MEAILIAIFVLGYAAIALEHPLKINKAASALLTGVLIWAVYILASPDKAAVSNNLTNHLGAVSGILFFLLGAMTIVGSSTRTTMDLNFNQPHHHDRKRKLLWIICLLTFFLSAMLVKTYDRNCDGDDGSQAYPGDQERLFFVGMTLSGKCGRSLVSDQGT